MEEYHYGSWVTVVISSVFFLLFTLSFLLPLKKREWRSAGLYTAFIIALFTEMFGFPLTIYILSWVFGISLGFSTEEGHLLANLLARLGILDLSIGVGLVMFISVVLILFGLFLIIDGWRRIHRSKGDLVTNGFYAFVRHPQYSGIFLITIAFLIQWPTILTLAMWPILAVMYYRLARREEKEMEAMFGAKYMEYKQRTPMFIPSIIRFKNLGGKGGE